jgi:beta-lactamase class A
MSRTATLFVVVLLVGACTGSGGPDGSGDAVPPSPASPAPPEPAPTTPSPTSTAVPPTDLTPTSALAEVVGWLNGQPIPEQRYRTLFTAAFVAEVGYRDFVALLDHVAAGGPWTVAAEQQVGERATVARMTPADGDELAVELSVTAGTPTRIDSLLLRPASPPGPPAGSLDDAVAALQDLGELHLVATEVTDGSCADPAVAVAADEPAPIASAFKLYVLGAVTTAVERGELSWQTPVTIRDDLDSYPSGVTQDEPDGTSSTVRALAERMIATSDNTATDHLIDLVGRDAVEAALGDYGHASPAATLPVLTTREAFVLKVGDDELRRTYAAADETRRRELLAGPVADAALPDLGSVDWTTPRAIDTIEWFASPTALCRVLVRLVADATTRAVLTTNPGVPDTAGRWEVVAYKGGSEPGVLAMAWWVRQPDGRSFVTAGSVTDADAVLDEPLVVQRFAEVRDLLGRP